MSDIERRLRDDATAIERQLSLSTIPPARPPGASGRRAIVAVGTLAVAASIVGVLLVANGPEDRIGPGEDSTIPVEATTPRPSSTQPPPATGRLRVTQELTSWGSGTEEGQISYLVVRGPDGRELASREFKALALITPAVDLVLAPGRYEIESYQRTCVETCSESLDDPSHQCAAFFDLTVRAELFVTATASGRNSCSLRTTDDPTVSPIPDEFALREPYRNCGESYPMEPGGPRGQSARRCLLRAHHDSATAELWERASFGNGSEYVHQVYRTEPNGTIVVYLPGHDGTDPTPWLRYTCAALVAEDDHVFEPVDCSQPTEVAATGSDGTKATAGSTAQPPVVARFTVEIDFLETQTTSCPPTEMRLIDRSSGNPTSWEWTFSDGSTSTEQNPRIRDAIDMGDVTLRVSNGNSTDETTQFVNFPEC